MSSPPSVLPTSLRRSTAIVSWPRIRTALIASVLPALMLSADSQTPLHVWFLRAALVAGVAMLAFGVAERRPRRLPRWLARWVFQLVAIGISAPIGAWLAYLLTTGGAPNFANEPSRVTGFIGLAVSCALIGPWIALAAMLRQREAFAREQAIAFDLERSELSRQATEARMRLLQAQVQPHFLFNTLANVQALVEAGSPRASAVLGNLIAYLRAAVPRLDESDTTFEQELELVRAYLDLMQLRMPDRLQYSLTVDPQARALRCPPMTLLTLVENAVRHGIDPAEDGGRVDISVQVHDGRCHLRVNDTGVGLRQGSGGLGTGLAALRERLLLVFGPEAQLRLLAREPRGVCAEIDFPAPMRPA
jgi:signal transduction histidine kinase